MQVVAPQNPMGSQMVGQAEPVLRCLECAVIRRQLRRHLRAAHKMDAQSYLAAHPGARLDTEESRKRSPECRARQSRAATQRWQTPEARAEQSKKLKAVAPWTGQKLSPEHRTAISRGRTKGELNEAGHTILGIRRGISHPCRSLMEANFVRVLLHEGVSYEYRPQVTGLDWTPAFRLFKPLWDVIPAGWVETAGWLREGGFLPTGTRTRVEIFQRETGDQVFVLSPGPLWDSIEALCAAQIPLWETVQSNLRTDPKRFGQVKRCL